MCLIIIVAKHQTSEDINGTQYLTPGKTHEAGVATAEHPATSISCLGLVGLCWKNQNLTEMLWARKRSRPWEKEQD